MKMQRGKSFLREKERQRLPGERRASAFIGSQRKFREKSRKRSFLHNENYSPSTIPHPTSCLQVSGVRAKQRSGTCGSRRHQEEPCWCGSDRLPSVSTGFRVQRYLSYPSLYMLSYVRSTIMLAFIFNQIKFKYFTCLPPRDPVQQEKPVFPSSGI